MYLFITSLFGEISARIFFATKIDWPISSGCPGFRFFPTQESALAFSCLGIQARSDQVSFWPGHAKK
jgi:hypothetical protein